MKSEEKPPSWSMDDWNFVEKQTVTDPEGRRWSVGIMDVLGQEGDPDMPSHLLEAQYQQGRYFTLVYSSTGAVQNERAYQSLPEATKAFEELCKRIFDGSYDPSQPFFRQDLED